LETGEPSQHSLVDTGKPSLLYVPPGLTFKKFYVLPTIYLSVLCLSQIIKRLFSYTTLTDLFL